MVPERRAGAASTPTNEDVVTARITYSIRYIFTPPFSRRPPRRAVKAKLSGCLAQDDALPRTRLRHNAKATNGRPSVIATDGLYPAVQALVHLITIGRRER